MNYSEFLQSKKHTQNDFGIDPVWMPDSMFDFQKYATENNIKKGRYASFIDTGLGKTIIELTTAYNYAKSTNKPVLILTPLAVAFQFIEEAIKFGIDDVSYSKDGKYKTKIVICNYERLHYFNPNDFECVICDECFPADTDINIIRDGKKISTTISNVIPGDEIFNCTGIDRVLSVKRKKIDYAIKIKYNGKHIISSPKHPYFTQRGWVPAKELQSTDYICSTEKAMRILRENISIEMEDRCKETILRDILFSEVEDGTTGIKNKSSHKRSSRKNRKEKIGMVQEARSEKGVRKNSNFETDAKYRNENEGFSDVERNETQTFSAWGKWNGNDISSAINEGCIVRELGSGISHIHGKISKGLSDKLQGRLSSIREKDCNRSGWKQPLQQKGTGREKGFISGFFRVESFEVLEQGCPELDKYREDDGSYYFYDLEIKRHPSFTINGGLVHNSSILKNFEGAIKNNITSFMKKMKYRYLFTATPSPNDFIELGTSSEALGYMGYTDMLTKFFTNNEDTISPQNIGTEWILKGHAKDKFFEWVSSWSLSMRKPSDLGFSDANHVLPELITNHHSVKNEKNMVIDGQILMFNMAARRLTEVREENKLTIQNRCERAVELTVNHPTSVYWCNLNNEGDLLQQMDKEAHQIKGSMNIDKKEELLMAFYKGEIGRLITKAKMTAFGLNWQHCNHTTYFPTFSYEQYYQAIRRFWRFGQKNPVTVDLVFSDGQKRVMDSLMVKAEKANELFSKLNSSINSNYIETKKGFDKQITLPKFLKTA